MLTLSVISTVNASAIIKRIDNDDFWRASANEWYRLMGRYTPRDTGELETKVTIKPKQIIYNAAHAVPVYHGDHMRFRKVNPYATARWDVAARHTELPKLLQFMAGHIKKSL